MRFLGGRPKPWGEILIAMRTGSLPFWLHGTGKFARRARVAISDIAHFTNVGFDEAAWPNFPFKQTYTQIDAAEMLNLDSLQIRRVMNIGALEFRPEGVAMIVDRAPVLELASAYIATAEIALRTGMGFTGVPNLMRRHTQVTRHEAGWLRCEFDKVFGAR